MIEIRPCVCVCERERERERENLERCHEEFELEWKNLTEIRMVKCYQSGTNN